MANGAASAFFSYSREDSDFALRLAGDLKAVGASVWLDQLDIVPGQRWDRAVEAALANCPRMLVILSPASINSTNVMDEVSFALEEEKTVIPLIHKDCAIPFRLRRVQYVDFRRDYARALKELVKTLASNQKAGQATPSISDVPSQRQTDVTEADRHEHAAEEERRGAAEEGKDALEHEQLEQEHKRTAERARLENDAEGAQERSRLEKDGKGAAEQPQLEQEPKQAADQARLAEECRKEEEQARREKERKVAEERRRQLEFERQGVPVEEQLPPEPGDIKGSVSSRSGFISRLSVWAKVVGVSCGILIIASIVYWAGRRQSASGQLLATLQGHTGWVLTAVFSPDGQRIATASADKTARVWDAASGQTLATLQGHTEEVQSAVFSPDGQRIVTASWDQTGRDDPLAVRRKLRALNA